MTTKQIDYCIELARTQNYSRAADKPFRGRPMFSRQIRLLEEIGFAVFERSGSRYKNHPKVLRIERGLNPGETDLVLREP